MVKSGDIAFWVYVPQDLVHLEQAMNTMRSSRNKKQEIYIAVNVDTDSGRGPYKFQIQMQPPGAMFGLDSVPELFQVSMREINQQPGYFQKNGLGKKKVWFIKVQVKDFAGWDYSGKGKDLRD